MIAPTIIATAMANSMVSRVVMRRPDCWQPSEHPQQSLGQISLKREQHDDCKGGCSHRHEADHELAVLISHNARCEEDCTGMSGEDSREHAHQQEQPETEFAMRY